MRSLAERFWEKVEKTESCWLWTASLTSAGYGQINSGRHAQPLLAHRVVYEMERGPIPVGLEIDHHCEVRHCVNPAHLEAVSHAVNVDRALGQRTHCPRGHPLDGLRRQTTRGVVRSVRYCKTCNRIRWRS